LQQYRVVEMKLLAQQRDLQAKIPDIEKCLDIVATLQAKKGSGEVAILNHVLSLQTREISENSNLKLGQPPAGKGPLLSNFKAKILFQKNPIKRLWCHVRSM
ncbi:hypothetical protein MTR67_003050, partial [Solanum verrucosum]